MLESLPRLSQLIFCLGIDCNFLFRLWLWLKKIWLMARRILKGLFRLLSHDLLNYPLKKLIFQRVFWVQVHGLHLQNLTAVNAIKIGKFIGDVKNVENEIVQGLLLFIISTLGLRLMSCNL
jgi:hypothetical protein